MGGALSIEGNCNLQYFRLSACHDPAAGGAVAYAPRLHLTYTPIDITCLLYTKYQHAHYCSSDHSIIMHSMHGQEREQYLTIIVGAVAILR